MEAYCVKGIVSTGVPKDRLHCGACLQSHCTAPDFGLNNFIDMYWADAANAKV